MKTFFIEQDCLVTPCSVMPKFGATSLPAVPIQKMAQWRHGSWTPVSKLL